MIQFSQAKPVAVGEAITSEQWNALADAFNSRLRSCLGDGPWRIAYYVYSLFRELFYSEQPTFPPSQVSIVPQASFFERFQGVEDPAANPWPAAAPGAAGGLSYGQVMSLFVVGNGTTAYGEPERSDGFAISGGSTPGAIWTNGKAQRGWIKSDSSASDSPALFMADAARAITAAASDWTVTHQDKGYGGYQDPNDTGTPQLRRTVGDTVYRALQAFDREFRGSTAQMAEPSYWLDEAADWQHALTGHHYLSPALEDSSATGTGLYPQWEALSAGNSLPAGTVLALIHPAGGGNHDQADGFGMSHLLVSASGTMDAVKVRVTHSGGSFDVVLDQNSPEAIFKAPQTQSYKGISMSLPDGATFDPVGGWVRVEINEILIRKPKIEDLYVIARMACTRDAAPDGRGTLTEISREAIQAYFDNGCVVNQYGASEMPRNPEGYANTNSVFEAAREMSKWIRVLDRRAFVSMECAGGKTSLWFRRNPIDVPEDDHFAGVYPIVADAPENGETNEWQVGVQLKPYGAEDQQLWDLFPDYYALLDRAHFGSADVYNTVNLNRVMCASRPGVNNKATTPEAPTMMRYAAKSTTGHGYEPAEPYNHGYLNEGRTVETPERERFFKSCRIYEPDLEIDTIEDFAPRPFRLIGADGTRVVDASANIVATNEVPAQIKVTLKGRLQNTSGESADAAPASYGWQHWDWSWADLVAETNTNYRTIENGLRMYLMHNWSRTAGGGVMQAPPTWGDACIDETNNPDSFVWDLWGAIYPHFYMVKLLPKVYSDGNDDQDPEDTPLWHPPMMMADAYLRAMCEGFLMRPAGGACDTAAYPTEWTYEQLLESVSGGNARHVGPCPAVPTSITPVEDCRTDRPWGAGPLPNTYAVAEHFNLLAEGVNKLRSVRLPWFADVDGTFTFAFTTAYNEAQAINGRTCADVPAIIQPGIPGPGPEGNGTPQGLPDPYFPRAYHQYRLDNTMCGVGGGYVIRTATQTVDLTVENVDLMEAALPPDVRTLLNNGNFGVSAYVYDSETIRTFEEIPDQTDPDYDPAFDQDGKYYALREVTTDLGRTCEIVRLKANWTAPPPSMPGDEGTSTWGGGYGEVGPDRNLDVAIDRGMNYTITAPIEPETP